MEAERERGKVVREAVRVGWKGREREKNEGFECGELKEEGRKEISGRGNNNQIDFPTGTRSPILGSTAAKIRANSSLTRAADL